MRPHFEPYRCPASDARFARRAAVHRRCWSRAILLCVVAVCGGVIQMNVSVFAADGSRPNVIVIMADDLGYGDVSCNGSTTISTPNIDRLAAGGVRFTSGYCSASTCTPTRYSFLTGQYAFRVPGTGIAPPNSPLIVPTDRPTIASMFRDAGYRTAVIGKWHLGLGPKPSGDADGGPDWNGRLAPGPLEIGFDECFLLPTTNDRVPQVYVEDHRVANLNPADPLWVGKTKPTEDHPTGITHRETLRMDWSHGHNGTIHNGISRIGFYTGGHAARFRDEDLADMWIDKSVEFIDRNADQSFFLFLASHDLHVPRMPHERFHGKSGLGFRGDSILQLDWCVGEIMKALERADLDQKTMVVFCSDNGPVMDDGYKDGALEQRGEHRAAGPFTGGKYSVYEGGTRTPLIARWPGVIQPGVSDKIVCTVDLPRSLAAVIGQPIADEVFPDSEDVADAFLGRGEAEGRDALVQQDNGNSGTYGFRRGDWKLHRYDRGRARNKVVEKPLANTKVNQFLLFNLANDPGETTNVLSEHPEVAESMKRALANALSN